MTNQEIEQKANLNVLEEFKVRYLQFFENIAKL